MQQLPGIVPLIERRCCVETFITLQTDQFCAKCVRQGLGDFSLANTRWTFDKERLTECHRQVKSSGQGCFGDVDLFFQHALDLAHFFSQFNLPFSPRTTCRSKSSQVLMSSGKGRSKS